MQRKTPPLLISLRRHGVHSRHVRPGTAPGSLDEPQIDAEADPALTPARISQMHYSRQGLLSEHHELPLADCKAPPVDDDSVTWLHLQGQPSTGQLQVLGQIFGLHPLALEDVLHREGRPKIEAFEAQQFLVLNRVHRLANSHLGADQLSLFLGKNYVISIHQGPDDIFEPIRQRIRSGGPACRHGADYLLYVLVDVVVDTAFMALEALGNQLEALEDEILDDPTREARNRIHYAKRELVLMRRAWWPQREVVATLMRDTEQMLSEHTRTYMRDCHDHCVIVIDFVETYREMMSSLLDTYLSAVNQRMNDIMKTLTIVATVFLPLTFITGLYGMNFDTASNWNMPELGWRFGYFYALGVMSAVVIGMVFYFRHKRWF